MMYMSYAGVTVAISGCVSHAGAAMGRGGEVGACGCCEVCLNGGLAAAIAGVASGLVRGISPRVGVGDDIRVCGTLVDDAVGGSVDGGAISATVVSTGHVDRQHVGEVRVAETNLGAEEQERFACGGGTCGAASCEGVGDAGQPTGCSDCVREPIGAKQTVGQSAGVPPARNTQRNREWRRERKARKLRKQSRGSSSGTVGAQAGFAARVTGGDIVKEVDEELSRSVKRKWIAKNELEALRAERDVAVLKATEVADEVQRYRTRVCAATERNMVSIEKTHALLRASGNVSEDGDSRVHTVLSSATISPDSSASQADFREAQKKILDQEKQIADMAAMLERFAGAKYESLLRADCQTFTDTSHNHAIIDDLYPGGVGVHTDYVAGKRVIRLGPEVPSC